MKKVGYTTILLMLFGMCAQAQFEIDKDLILNGALGSDRQVEGLGDPVDETALLRASSIQMNSVSYATATGTNDLDILMDPAPGNISAGTSLNIFISSNNTGAVSITVNGMGPYPIKKNVDKDLVAADLMSGQVVRVIFDGTVFQLMNARNLGRRDCPSGFLAVNKQYCIEQNERDTVTFFQAAQVCGDLGGRLCTWGEWNWACRDTSLQMNGRTGNWEWTGSTANGDHLVRVVGESSCTQSATSPDQPTPARNFRCCFTR